MLSDARSMFCTDARERLSFQSGIIPSNPEKTRLFFFMSKRLKRDSARDPEKLIYIY